jgi:hypothetical protein
MESLAGVLLSPLAVGHDKTLEMKRLMRRTTWLARSGVGEDSAVVERKGRHR